MNCLVWNARGLGSPSAFREFRRALADNSPSLVFVCETIVTETRCRWWRTVLGFDGFFMVNAAGRSGGLLMLWKDPCSVHVLSFSKGHIDCKVLLDESVFRFTGFYGDPDPRERHFSWSLLRRLANIGELAGLPWIVGGDFNEIVSQGEKKGGRRRRRSQMETFSQTLEDCNLKDYFATNSSFTWHNNRDGGEAIWGRLDRMVMTPSWIDNYIFSRLDHLDNYGSDHRALLLRVTPTGQTSTGGGKKCFHFEQKWFLETSFVGDFLMEWKELRGYALPERLQKSQSFLTKWAGKRFDALEKQISKLRKERVRLLNQ